MENQETTNLSIRSSDLPENASIGQWRGWGALLWFFVSVILKSAWEEKFHDLGILHRHLCEYLDPNINPSRRKFIAVFRGSYKTTVLLGLCVYLFCWAVLRGESISINYNTATKDNAETFMDDFRHTLLNCKMLHWIFKIPSDAGQYAKFTNKIVKFKYARFTVSSLETRQVSRHHTVYINDDLVNDDNAFSQTERENVIRKWKLQKSIVTKYKKRNIGLEIDVGTPFHHADLVSYIIKNIKSYDKFILPNAIPNPNGPDLSQVNVLNPNGDLMLSFPEMFTWDDFLEIYEDQGASIYSTQYRLMVLDDSDRICYEQWLKRWVWLPENFNRYFIIDPAGTEDKKKNDPTGFIIFDVDEKGYVYLVYAEQLWVRPYPLIKHIEALQENFKPDETYIEKEKYSITIADTVEHLAPKLNFMFVENKNEPGEKRIRRLKQYFETGRILLGPNMKSFERQALDYPGSDHDDMLTALAYGLRIMTIPQKGVVRVQESKEETDFEQEIKRMTERIERYRQKENHDQIF